MLLIDHSPIFFLFSSLQHVAIRSFTSKYKAAAVDLLMRVVRNQIIAKEGVMTYNGKKYLKRWANLAQYIGVTVPITEEHPSGNQVTETTRTFGWAEYHKCPIGANILCATLYLYDDAPETAGYSIGFRFIEIEESGTFHAEEYDAVQDITGMDHLALTNFPRDANALNDEYYNVVYDPNPPLVTDGVEIVGDAVSRVNINKVACDSYKFVPVRKDGQSNFGEDSTLGEIEDLREQVKKLAAEKQEADSVKSELAQVKAKLAVTEKAIVDREAQITQSAIDSLKNEWEFTDKELEGYDSQFIRGMKHACDKIAEASKKQISNATAQLVKPAGDSTGIPSVTRMVYENGKLVYK